MNLHAKKLYTFLSWNPNIIWKTPGQGFIFYIYESFLLLYGQPKKLFMKKFTTHFLSIIIAVLALFGFSFESKAQQVLETQSYTGHLVRTTPTLADLDKTSMYGQPFVMTRDMNGVIVNGSGDFARAKRATKGIIEQQLREAGTGFITEGIQKPGAITPNVPGTSIGVNIAGLTSPGLSPTDNNMAAGPNHIIQCVNNTAGTQFRVWDKAGNPIGGTVILASLTGFPGFGDPVVLYDQLADRWLMVEFGPAPPTHNLNIAVSTTGNPTGTWNIYQYQDLSFFIDYHKFSVWHNAYYATSNDFNNAGTTYLGSSVYSMERSAMIAGAPTAVMVRTRQTIAGNNYYNMGTIGLEGMIPSAQGGLFAFPVPPTTMNLFEVTPNFAAGTQAIGPLIPLTINAYSAPPASVAQQGSGTIINTLGERMMFKLNYRNNTGTESIVMTHTVNNAGLAAVRWYELRRVAGNWTVFQQGTITGADGNSRFMGGISMDGCGNIALMYDKSGTTSFPSMVYTGRNSFDPLNTMTLPEATIINGTSAHTNSRWGDYNTTVQDYTAPGVPTNGSFWSTSQHSNQQTRIANFSLTGGCAAAPAITAGTATLTAEGCVPNNGVIDPGETVTVSFCVNNVGSSPTVNLVGTMQATGGVTPISGPQNYGIVVNGGPAVCRSFSFSNTSGICGGSITVSIQMQDGPTNLGTVTWTFTLGTTVIASGENFDAVVAPALPAGWVATNPVGGGVLWVTSNSGTPAPPAASAPNALFIDDPAIITDKQITTPSFVPGGGSRVSFANNFNLESTFDGGVLEISINGGAFQDIIAAGGSFVTGGYTGLISTAFGSPIAGRQAWTGSSGAFITTTVNMPVASFGQPTVLKFRMASDNSVAAVGWRVDNYSVSQPACCGAACSITCPPNMTVNTGPGATSCGTNVTYPPATTTGLCGIVTYSNPSGSFFPKGTTTVTVTAAAGPTCTFTVTVVDNTPPVITCPANISVNNTPGLCSAVVTYPLPTVTDNCGLPGPITLQQTASQTPVAGSVACNAGGFHTLNSYFRAYNLGPMALPGPVQINSVQFGIELADANGTGTTQPVTVNVYTSAGAFPGGVRTLVGTSGVVQVSDQTLTTMTVPITVPPTVPANAILVLELVTPDGRAPANNRFFIGSNTSAQTGPSYIQAADCGIPTPTDLTAIGFPNMHIILNAIGQITGPSPLVQIAGLPSGSVFPVGVTTNTFRATDIAGNTATCSFTVTVVDNQPPVLVCPPSVVRNTDPGVCTSTYAPPNPTNSDNCAVTTLTWVMTGATTGASPLTGINFVGTQAFGLTGTTGQGITTITYTAKDAAGNTTTCSFTVTVNDASIPVITGQPTTQFVCVGSDAVFTVTASAGAGNPLAYQWQTWTGPSGPWVNIPGATSATLTLPAVAFSQNTTDYRVILTGRCSVVTSAFATLYVNPLPTVSILASRPLALLPGQNLTLTAVVSPGGGAYQWFKNGVAIPGATGATLSNLTVDDIGSYTVRYTDLNGCVRTSSAMVVTGENSCRLWLYPNPTRGVFQLRFNNAINEKVTVNIFNSGGSKVYSQSVSTGLPYSRIDVDITNEGAGVYIVEVIDATGKRACNAKEKFIKTH